MSKLLKQNGVDGKILRSNDGSKVLKQNYIFGNAWKSYNIDGAYIEISKNINANTSFTFGTYCTEKGSQVVIDPITTNLGNYFFTHRWDRENGRFFYNGGVSNNFSNNFQIVTLDNTEVNSKGFYDNSFTNFANGKLLSDITNINILGNKGNAASYLKYANVIIYDRALSLDECKYLHNNGLGNDLLNIQGLWAEYQLSYAEILNTGGADFVGVRDVSGNGNHQPILNMPAGTLEEQRDRANLLYFETW